MGNNFALELFHEFRYSVSEIFEHKLDLNISLHLSICGHWTLMQSQSVIWFPTQLQFRIAVSNVFPFWEIKRIIFNILLPMPFQLSISLLLYLIIQLFNCHCISTAWRPTIDDPEFSTSKISRGQFERKLWPQSRVLHVLKIMWHFEHPVAYKKEKYCKKSFRFFHVWFLVVIVCAPYVQLFCALVIQWGFVGLAMGFLDCSSNCLSRDTFRWSGQKS